ncbi:MAG: Jag N-terminal domain-containing protein, partial [Clostridiaceae bacterium]|nr:Jag N-terminal domain-containing protein [Clostridiaceae bacterium]
MIMLEKTARTIEEAVQSALTELGVDKDNIDIEILEQPTKGIFGIIGSKSAKVRVTLKDESITE